MSLKAWKKLAEKKTKTGQEVNPLFDKITEEEVRSKPTDQAITKTFKLDELLAAQKRQAPLQKRQRRPQEQRREEGIDYAPEVDPYEDMDVEGLLNLEDYVAPQTEKQIAKKPELPKYQIDPSYWDLPPPEYMK